MRKWVVLRWILVWLWWKSRGVRGKEMRRRRG